MSLGRGGHTSAHNRRSFRTASNWRKGSESLDCWVSGSPYAGWLWEERLSMVRCSSQQRTVLWEALLGSVGPWHLHPWESRLLWFWMEEQIWIAHCKTLSRDLPGVTVNKNPPANAGDTGLIPGLGGFHMLWRSSSPYAIAAELAAWEPSAPQWEATQWAAYAHKESSPHAP